MPGGLGRAAFSSSQGKGRRRQSRDVAHGPGVIRRADTGVLLAVDIAHGLAHQPAPNQRSDSNVASKRECSGRDPSNGEPGHPGSPTVSWSKHHTPADQRKPGGASWNRTSDLSIISAMVWRGRSGADQAVCGQRSQVPAGRDPYVTHWARPLRFRRPASGGDVARHLRARGGPR